MIIEGKGGLLTFTQLDNIESVSAACVISIIFSCTLPRVSHTTVAISPFQ